MSADTVAEPRTDEVRPTVSRDAAEPVTPRTPARMAARDRALALVPLLAALGWALSLLPADPRQMGSLGLITLLNAGSVAALVLLAGGFLLSLSRNLPEWVLGAYLVTFIALVHATPAVLYGTLRYSWAFKHVGIVDYIQRTGTVDPTLAFGGIYHNWPGMFAGSALLTEIAGEPDALRIATWAPLAFNLMNLIVLRYVFRGLTRNRRLIWLGLWIFFVINWVGQDYFSPQAMVYVLYLAVIGLLMRRSINPLVLGTLVLLVSVVAASHQITPMMLLLAVTALVALRRTPGWYLPLITGGLIAGWPSPVRRRTPSPTCTSTSRASGDRWPMRRRPWRRPGTSSPAVRPWSSGPAAPSSASPPSRRSSAPGAAGGSAGCGSRPCS